MGQKALGAISFQSLYKTIGHRSILSWKRIISAPLPYLFVSLALQNKFLSRGVTGEVYEILFGIFPTATPSMGIKHLKDKAIHHGWESITCKISLTQSYQISN